MNRTVLVLLSTYAGCALLVGVIVKPELAQDFLRVAMLGGAGVMVGWIVTIAHRHRTDPGARMPNYLVWGMGGTVALQIVYMAQEVWGRIGDPLGVPSLFLGLMLMVTAGWLWRFERFYAKRG